jgi:hypothetical protein
MWLNATISMVAVSDATNRKYTIDLTILRSLALFSYAGIVRIGTLRRYRSVWIEDILVS